ncbi:MAG TPA: hypothetical protein VLB76_12240 [Thermoanaerobaculia bacterium]|jgi:hypothetical protein|nr:hypothetical protein [Thermoanaerobaculia bacterium]
MSVNNAGTLAATTHQIDTREPLPTKFASRFISDVSSARPPAVDPRTFSSAFEPVPVAQAPRVVSQSVAAGLIVPQGTTVNLVVAPSSVIPVDIFSSVPDFLQGVTVDQVLLSATDPSVKNILVKGTPLTAVEKDAVKAQVKKIKPDLSDAQFDAQLDQTLTTLRNATLFE